jgi:hypothetical protein
MKSSAIVVGLIALVSILPSAIFAETTTLTFREGDGGAYSTTYGATVYPVTNAASASNALLSAQWGSDELDNSLSFVRFPEIFGNNVGQIPLGSKIESASLYITRVNASAEAASVSMASKEWDENNISGDNYPDAFWTPPYQKIAAGDPGTYVVDVTGYVQTWSIGTANYGFEISAGGITEETFYSDDESTAEFRPMLTVTFTPPLMATEQTTWGRVKALYR